MIKALGHRFPTKSKTTWPEDNHTYSSHLLAIWSPSADHHSTGPTSINQYFSFLQTLFFQISWAINNFSERKKKESDGKGAKILWKKKHIYLPVSQRRNDKPVGTSQEFILINKIHISNGHHTLVSLLTEVEAWLFQPFKICRYLDILAALVTNWWNGSKSYISW